MVTMLGVQYVGVSNNLLIPYTWSDTPYPKSSFVPVGRPFVIALAWIAPVLFQPLYGIFRHAQLTQDHGWTVSVVKALIPSSIISGKFSTDESSRMREMTKMYIVIAAINTVVWALVVGLIYGVIKRFRLRNSRTGVGGAAVF